MPIEIFVDADACPVKEEVFRVAGRHGLKTHVVANSFMRVPRDPLIEFVLVQAGPDAADDWIAARATPEAVVITNDIPLASRCIAVGAQVIGATGKPFTEASIGMALATRNLMEHLRSTGEMTGGPRPFAAKDRSAFLQALDTAIMRLKRNATTPSPRREEGQG